MTRLCIYYTILFTVIAECTLSTRQEKVVGKQCVGLHRQQPRASPVYHASLGGIIFSRFLFHLVSF